MVYEAGAGAAPETRWKVVEEVHPRAPRLGRPVRYGAAAKDRLVGIDQGRARFVDRVEEMGGDESAGAGGDLDRDQPAVWPLNQLKMAEAGAQAEGSKAAAP